MSHKQRKALDRNHRVRKAINIRRNNLPHNVPVKDDDGNVVKGIDGKLLMERNPLKQTITHQPQWARQEPKLPPHGNGWEVLKKESKDG
jgi:hypothetical protein